MKKSSHILILSLFLTATNANAHKACRINPQLTYDEIETFAGYNAAKIQVISCKDMMAIHLWRKDNNIRSMMQLKQNHVRTQSLGQMKVKL